MANLQALVFTGIQHQRCLDVDTLEVGSGIQSRGTNAALAMNAVGSGTVDIAGGAGTGATNIARGASAGALNAGRTGVLSRFYGTFQVDEAATFTAVVNTNGGVQRSSAGALNVGTTSNTTSVAIGTDAACTTTTVGHNTATVEIGAAGQSGATLNLNGNVTVRGTETIVGGQTHQGLFTVTSATGGGAANALGPEEIRVEMTQAADGTNTIRNPGSVRFSGRTWTGAASAEQVFGGFGATIDTIDGAGAVTGMSYRYRNIASGADIGRLTQAGTLELSGSLGIRGGGSNLLTLSPSGDVAVTVTVPSVTDTLVNLASTQTLTNKTLTSPVVGTQITLDAGANDYTVTWAAPAATRALSIADPGGADTFAFLAAVQTFTNKTLTSPTLGGTITLTGNETRAGDHTVDLTGAATRTLDVLNSTASQVANLRVDGVLQFRNGTTFAHSLSGTPTVDRTITFPDSDGTVYLLGLAQTITARKLHQAKVAVDSGGGARGFAHGGWTADSTAGQQVLTGDAVALSTTASTLRICNASTSGATDASATCLGVWDGTDLVDSGTVVANFETGLTLAVGDPIYLSAGTGIKRGALTNVAPSTAAQRVAFVGYVKDTTGYVNTTAEPIAEGTAWPAGLQAQILLRLGRSPILL